MSSCVPRCTSFLKRSFQGNFLAPIHSKFPTIRHLHQSNFSKCQIQLARAVNSRAAHVIHARSRTVTSRDESRDLMAVWPDVVRDLTDAGRHLDIPYVTKWLAKVLQYNVPNGKKTRALSLIYAYRQFAPEDQLTEENIRLARILAWCVEMVTWTKIVRPDVTFTLQAISMPKIKYNKLYVDSHVLGHCASAQYHAFFLVEDDLTDQGTTRRGQPCWYRYNNLGLAAINDGLLLEQSMFQLLRIHFKNKECYLNLVEMFHEMILKTIMGQILDTLPSHSGTKSKLELFTMEHYNAIVKYKTAYYSFAMPVQLAMYFAGITDAEMHRQAKTILLEMGHFYQVQDDYLDVYGDPEKTGKIGTDIQDGKCSWLAVVALQRATPSQRRILEECYGHDDPEKISRVRQLFNELGLATTYAIYEEENYNLMNTHIQQISRGLPHAVFFKFLEKIYRRDR